MLPEKHLARWIRLMTGCSFARDLAHPPDRCIRYSEFINVDDEVPDQLTAALEGCYADGLAFVALFSSIRGRDDLLQLLAILSKAERWRCRQDRSRNEEELLVSVEWRTPDGPRSSCLGLAPLFEMPVTRRAPFIALALWPGPRTTSKDRPVGFRDMPSSHDAPRRKELIDKTQETVRGLMDPEDRAIEWERVTFRLPAATCEALRLESTADGRSTPR